MSKLLKDSLNARAELVEKALSERLSQSPAEEPLRTLEVAVKYGALGRGKRIRPFLLIEAATLVGASATMAMPAACAIEMVHAYSLIHDDLPAMDDSDERRGQPSVHKAFDEAIAILAGDGLLTDAFAVLTDGTYPPNVAAELVHSLALAAGSQGMVGGQMMDLYPPDMSEEAIIAIQERKTGALIEAAVQMGGIVGGADTATCIALKRYAQAVGLAFQIVDDVLDVTQPAEVLGKPAGADDAAGKATFVSLLGLEGARGRITKLTEEAHDALAPFGDRAALLKELATNLAERTH
ncbi:MAG: polyprenyl synthetase family protein [Pseudomonadota bacterium]